MWKKTNKINKMLYNLVYFTNAKKIYFLKGIGIKLFWLIRRYLVKAFLTK